MELQLVLQKADMIRSRYEHLRQERHLLQPPGGFQMLPSGAVAVENVIAGICKDCGFRKDDEVHEDTHRAEGATRPGLVKIQVVAPFSTAAADIHFLAAIGIETPPLPPRRPAAQE